jgi:hypothetical protein
MFPSISVLFAVAGLTFLLQRKWIWTRRVLTAVPLIGPGLADCSFCLGCHLGALVGLAYVGVEVNATGWSWWAPVIVAISVFGSGAASLVLDDVTSKGNV